jgi:hypothetical protein
MRSKLLQRHNPAELGRCYKPALRQPLADHAENVHIPLGRGRIRCPIA